MSDCKGGMDINWDTAVVELKRLGPIENFIPPDPDVTITDTVTGKTLYTGKCGTFQGNDMVVFRANLIPTEPDMGCIRTFETGATRDTDSGKHDYRGYLSPLVLKRYGEYMTKHRIQPDGAVRASDNWKKGIPQPEYLSSALRHVVDVWLLHEGYDGVATQDIEEALCGLLFNIQGYLHSYLEGDEWPSFTLTEDEKVGGALAESNEEV